MSALSEIFSLPALLAPAKALAPEVSAAQAAGAQALPGWGYLFAGLLIAALITAAIRLVGFGAKRALRQSSVLAQFERWMPLMVVTGLTTYFLLGMDVSSVNAALPWVAGSIVTVGLHLWRSNFVLSIAGGAGVCVLLSNLNW